MVGLAVSLVMFPNKIKLNSVATLCQADFDDVLYIYENILSDGKGDM